MAAAVDTQPSGHAAELSVAGSRSQVNAALVAVPVHVAGTLTAAAAWSEKCGLCCIWQASWSSVMLCTTAGKVGHDNSTLRQYPPHPPVSYALSPLPFRVVRVGEKGRQWRYRRGGRWIEVRCGVAWMQVDEVESTSERHVSAVRGEGQWTGVRSHGWRNKGGKAHTQRRRGAEKVV